MAKTYGEKPIIFSFEENGEQYMIGSEVSQFSPYNPTFLIDILSHRLVTTSVCSEELSTRSSPG